MQTTAARGTFGADTRGENELSVGGVHLAGGRLAKNDEKERRI